MKRALISVSDKTGAAEFARCLALAGYEIISTGGTLKALVETGINAISVEDVTGFAECLDGRVKTLHPSVHGAVLAVRDNPKHMEQISNMDISPIDIVVVNLYPFKQTILSENFTNDEAIEKIDIGGPAMIRSAAKNYQYVSVVTDPSDYSKIIDEINANGSVCLETRLYLSAKAFAHTAAYDALIADYMRSVSGLPVFGETLTLTYEKKSGLRYGENPHQNAAYYKEVKPIRGTLESAVQLHGKELSFNNINDLSGAVALLKEFDEPSCVCVKHSVPCGVGEADDILAAYTKAYESDPLSIYGGIVALNRTVDSKTAQKMNEIFLEIVAAPAYTDEALEILRLKKNIRIMKLADIALKPESGQLDIKRVQGGILVQEADHTLLNIDEVKCVTKRSPNKSEMKDLLFAFKVVKHAKSNAITICKDGQTLGIGGGQVRRSWAVTQAIDHAVEILGNNATTGACMASDAFFTYDDCVEMAHKAGISAIIQPGGSVRDADSIKLCDKYGIAMLFTGIRHFRH